VPAESGNVVRACLHHNEVVCIDRLRSSRHLVFTKQFSDRIIAALALFFFAPLLIVVAILIKLDSPGPVFFRQRRTGYLGRRFTLYKCIATLKDKKQHCRRTIFLRRIRRISNCGKTRG